MGLPFPEYDDLDAVGLAELVSSGQITAEEVLDAALARVDERNPALNAVVNDFRERARSALPNLPNGPLQGVPFLLKDLKAMLAGTITTDSCSLYASRVAETSNVLVERYQAAGLQIFGKTNTPEMGIMGVTESVLRGPCRNPWAVDRSPGGSSGGAAAAVAARIVPVAHAGDGGGSIRIPASHCGLFGLKPTRGRITQGPFRGESWQGFVQEHVVTRSVRDSALMLDLTARPNIGEPYVAPPPHHPWRQDVGSDPGSLRIGVFMGALFGVQIGAENLRAVKQAANLLRDLGHEVVEAVPPVVAARDELIHAYLLTVAAGTAYAVEQAAAFANRRPRATDFEPSTWLLALIGWKCSAAEMVRARHTIQRHARNVAAFFQQHQVFLTATTAGVPPLIGSMDPSAAERAQMAALRMLPLKPLLEIALQKMGTGRLADVPNTQLFNLTGQPAASLPLHWSDEGLPVGVQLVTRFGDEATLFRLSSQLESAQPWAHRKPPTILTD